MTADASPIVLTSDSGYVVLQRADGALPPDAGQVLLPLARAAIADELGMGRPARDDLPWLQQQGACFITVTQGENLRGCIGTLRPHRTLSEDVRANAVAAAFRDPRFKPRRRAVSVRPVTGVAPQACSWEMSVARSSIALAVARSTAWASA